MAKEIRIVAKVDGFRRCGIAHSGTKTYPMDTFTKEQLVALKAETNLVVDEIDVSNGAPAKTGGSSRPAALAEVIADIKNVIPGLDEEKDFTQGGRPRVGPVETLLEYDITAEEAQTAWDEFQAAQG